MDPADGQPGAYLALGDSLAVGVGSSNPGAGSYVARFFEMLQRQPGSGIGRLVNLAVSGETSDSLINGGQLERGLRTIAEIGPALRLVTIDIGGNDLLWLAVSEPCASSPNSDACRRAVISTLDRFEANYRAVLSRLLEAVTRSASPQTRLMAVTYYNPFSGTGDVLEPAGDDALLGVDRVLDCPAAGVESEKRGMNDAIACAARDLGIEVADVYGSFVGRGRELTLIGQGDIHPNDAGYAEMANALMDRYRSAPTTA